MQSDSVKKRGALLLLVVCLALLGPSASLSAAPLTPTASVPEADFVYSDHRGLSSFALQQVEAPARALVLDAGSDASLARLMRASELSPELPLVHFALAQELSRVGEHGAAFQAGLRGLLALPDHVEGRFWWMGSLGILLAMMMIVSGLLFLFLVGLAFFRSAAHDLGDLFSAQMPGFARVALLSAFLLIPLALGEGLLGLGCGFFVIGVVYGRSIHRTTLALAVLLLTTGTFVVTNWAGQAADALEADPVASSALALVRGRATSAQWELLEYAADSRQDTLALRSLAVHAGRRGDETRLRHYLGELLGLEKNDPMALVLLGNLAFRSGDSEEAVRLYNQATFRGHSFELFFNLAQAHAKTFQIQQFEKAMGQAQAIDAERATHLTGLGQPELVLDPTFPMRALGQRLWLSSDGSPWVRFASSRVAPGWLGVSPVNVLGVFALLWIGARLMRDRFEQAGHCKRCGTAICGRCDTSLWSHEMCESCHFLFSRPKSADPEVRNARIQSLWTRERRVGRCLNLLSLSIPGFAGIRVKRPDLSLLSIFLFVGAGVFWIFRDGPFPEPLVTGGAASGILISFSGLLFVSYLVSMLVGFSMQRRL